MGALATLPVKEPGRLSRAVARLWMKPATVTANERLADCLRSANSKASSTSTPK